MSEYNKRLEMIKKELIINLEGPHEFELKELVKNYICNGLKCGIGYEDLISAIGEFKELHNFASHLEKNKFDCGLTSPTLKHGQSVEVLLNERNRTYRKGIIVDMIWHQKDLKWYYFIRSNGRKVSKRYTADDLKLLDSRKKLSERL